MSTGTYTPPIISVTYDADEGQHVLMATNHGRTSTAGERILRAEPWPEIQFKHDSAETAERDAATLRAYLDECSAGRRRDKEDEPTRRGWWED